MSNNPRIESADVMEAGVSEGLQATSMNASSATATSTAKPSYKKVSPWVYLPHLEFVYGLIRNYTQSFISLIFKTMGANNTFVGISSFIQMPLSFRALWAPFVDRMGTYRQTMLRSLFLTSFISAGIGIMILLGFSKLWLIAATFLLLVFVVSVFDTAYMGYKMSVLSTKEIEFFVGVGNGFFRLGIMFGTAILVYLVGVVYSMTDSYDIAWGCILLSGAMIMFAGACYLKRKLPFAKIDTGKHDRISAKEYFLCYVNFVKQPRGKVLTFYFLTAVFGEGVLGGMKVPFFIDSAEKGGLGMSLTALGIISPFIVFAMLAAGVWGGFILRKYGLNRVFFPLGVLMFLPNVFICLLALYPEQASYHFLISWLPGDGSVLYPWALLAGVVEMAGYALGFSCYKALEALVSKRAGHLRGTYGAIIGSLNIMGLTFGAGISGVIQEWVGYFWLFNISTIFSFIPWLAIPFLPVKSIMEDSDRLDSENQ